MSGPQRARSGQNPYGVIIPAPIQSLGVDPVVELFDTEAPDGFEPLPAPMPSGGDTPTAYAPIPGPGGATPYAPIPGPGGVTPYAPIPGAKGQRPLVPGPRQAPAPPHAAPPPRPRARADSSLVDMRDLGRKKDQKYGVKYVVDPTLRTAKYRVEMGWRLKRRGGHLDTREIKNHFSNRSYDLGMASLGSRRTGQPFPIPEDWAYDSCIWVCVPDGRGGAEFFTHVGKMNRFHHSSLVAGDRVICAGEWIVRNGSLLKISANSGHYRPPISALHRAVLHMSPAHQVRTTVFLYDRQDDTWVDYPVAAFAADPTRGGRYQTHPLAGGS